MSEIFFDDGATRILNLSQVMDVLLNIHDYYYNCDAYNEEDYRKANIASWVEKVVGKDAKHDNLFLLLADISRNGYESVEQHKEIVVYDINEDEYLDKYLTLVPIQEAMRFKTKEDAVKFVLENYEFKEIYEDEN
jgi:hypothetical protein